MLKILDTFAGIGGFSYGLEQTSHYQTAAFCEINPASQYWLRSRWPGKPIYSDIKALNGKEIIAQVGSIDIITGGFPCQDISVAGKQEGLGTKEEPTRSGLFYQLARVIDEVRPVWILLENVAALKSKGYDAVHGELQSLQYTCWPTVVSAENIGATHRRERIWIIGCDTRKLGNAECYGPFATAFTGSIGASILWPSQGTHEAKQSAGTSSSGELANCPPPWKPFVANTQSQSDSYRESGHLDDSPQGRQGDNAAAGNSSINGNMADTVSNGLQGWLPIRTDTQRQSVSGSSGYSGAGLPQRWPARPGQEQHEWEASRLTANSSSEPGLGKLPNGLPSQLSTHSRIRNQQLMAYGNSIVPQIAYVWGQVIHDLHALLFA